MSEQENSIFGTGGDIDLGGNADPMDFDPFADTPEETPADTVPMLHTVEQTEAEPAAQPKPAPVTAPQTEAAPVQTPKQTSAQPSAVNPLEQAMDAAQAKEADAAKESIFSRAPQFVYANATEDITDQSKTFEDLRLEKSADFPELEDGKRVSWTVEYGKVTKAVTDPKGTTVGKMKTQIETSKEFLDALKKMKPDEREKAVCKIKPRVTAQSKGDQRAAGPDLRCGGDEGRFPSYKALFTSPEEAEASGKTICILPARDGQVYEMRKNEIGTFITPANNVPELSLVRAGFIPALPRVPASVLKEIVAFFRSFMDGERQFEALVHLLWDKETGEYSVYVPKQSVTKASVHATLTCELDSARYIHVMDIHSHNDMAARFSAIDDADEKATRLYAVIGRLDRYWPSISVRMSNGGKYLPVKPEQVFEDVHEAFPREWVESVTLPPSKPNLAKVHLAEYARIAAGGEDV